MTTAPRPTSPNRPPLTRMSILILILFVVSLVFGNFQRVNSSFSRRFTKEASCSSFPAKPSMLLAKRKLVIVLPPMLTVPL